MPSLIMSPRTDSGSNLPLPLTTVCGAGILALAACAITGFGLTWLTRHPAPFVVSMLLGALLFFSIRQADPWEKAVVLRMGNFLGLRGPGLFWVTPLLENISRIVDQRIRVTDVTAEAALTRDTVPVTVDAIVYWVVWDARKCVLEVQDYTSAITLGAQTALREAIGAHELADLITRRDAIGKELQRILDDKTNPWGITVQSVEIKQVNIPPALEDAMSRKAQAERERQARIILGAAETEISVKFAEAAKMYEGNPIALNLRAMNMLYEAIKEKGSMVIVPSSAVDTMGLGGILGTASAARHMNPPPPPPTS